MAITLHPDGGFFCSRLVGGVQLETRVLWGNSPEGAVVKITRADGNGNGMALVALLADFLGGGLQVEFNQGLLSSDPGCAPMPDRDSVRLAAQLVDLSGDIAAIAGRLGIEVPEDDFSHEVIKDALLQIGEQVAGAQSAELRPIGDGPEPPAHFKEPEPTSSDPLLDKPATATIAGVRVAEAPAEQPKATRKRRTRAEIEADNAAAEAAKKPATVPAQPTTPDPKATEAFKQEMATLSGKVDELPKASLVEVKPPADAPAQGPRPEPHVEPVGDALDEAVELLSSPPMPADLHPLDSKRSQSDPQYLDTAQIRLYFGYPLVEEYAKNREFKPKNPPAPGVNLNTDEGVVAAVQWMRAIHERAGQRGVAIPQLDLFFGLGDYEEVLEGAVLKCRARREARAAQLAAAQGR